MEWKLLHMPEAGLGSGRWGQALPLSPPVWLWFSLSSARAVSSELRDLRW